MPQVCRTMVLVLLWKRSRGTPVEADMKRI
nr:MAG TPA: hypothetical protein [Caudoviricetes sp.]